MFLLGDKYVIALVKNVNEIGFLSLEKVRTQVENSVIQQKKVDKVYAEYFENQKVTDMEAFAEKIGTQVISVPNVGFNAFQLASIGYEPAILGALSKLQDNAVYGPIKGQNGAYFVKVTERMPAIEMTPEEITQQKLRMKSGLQQRASYQAYTALKDAAKIVDKRSNFF